jgi:drug/metabolite transporter (DMT)-like permease
MSWFVLVVLGTIWGASYLFIKVGGAEIPPLTFAVSRTIIASLALGLVILLRRERLPRPTRGIWLALLAMGIFNSAIPYTLITWGETQISSGLAGILTAMMPIFTVLIAHVITYDEKLNLNKVIGIVLGSAGVVVLFSPNLQTSLRLSLLGELAVVAASASYGFSSVVAHKYIQGVSHITAAFGQLASASLVLLPLSLIVDRPIGLHPSVAALASLGTLALLGTAFAYLLYYWLIDHSGATITSLVTYIIPVSAIVLGGLVLKEHFDWTAFAGLVGIIAGVGLVSLRSTEISAVAVSVEAE